MNKRRHIYAWALAAAIVFGATANVQGASSREAQALGSATVSLTQAVEIGEKQGQGKTIGAEFDIEKERPVWEVKVLNNSGVSEYKVDAMSGQVAKIEDEYIRGKLTTFVTGTNLKDLERVKTTLAQAVGMAERKFGGKAVKVQVEHERGGVQFDVFVRTSDRTDRVKIDAMNTRARQPK